MQIAKEENKGITFSTKKKKEKKRKIIYSF